LVNALASVEPTAGRFGAVASLILILDDDPEFRRLLLPALTGRGHRVIETARAEEANRILESVTPDLMIVDGLLPDMDGATWIGTLPAFLKKKPVVFISSFWRSLRDHQRLTTRLGVALVVHKPISPSVLAEQVESLLGLRESTPVPEITPEALAAMAQMRAEYARDLPGKLNALVASVASARAGQAQVALRLEARTLAHRISGTAGSYGFPEVGSACAHLEELIVGLGETLESALPAAWASVSQAAATVLVAAARSSQTPDAPEPRANEPRFLVVDDDPAVLAYVEALGRQQAIEVIRAYDEPEALARARQFSPDVAILDVALGEDKSFNLARELRSLPGLEQLPLAFMSIDAGLDNRIAAAHAGGSLFLVKPLEPVSFAGAVRQLVALREAARPRVLVVDDDPQFLQLVSAVLRSDGMAVSTLSDGLQVLDALQQNRPDLLILDILLPGFSGFDLCRMLRTTPEWQELPIVFVTASSSAQSRIAAYQAKADDYLQKPVVREELLARVRVRVERARLMREKGYRDSLTGVLLRRAFVETVEARLAECRRRDAKLSVAILDLDDFKSLNDRHGHLSADRVLARLGALMQTRFRVEDVRGRWGGEEFVLGIAGEGVAMTHLLVERLLSELQAMEFLNDRGESFRAGFSAGVATYPEDGQALEDLMRAADRRLLDAKAQGKGRVIRAG
jgi:diguanylate cyclase (GGDEF)-like protein